MNPGLGRDVEIQNQLRRFAFLPFTAVAIVLLIACANVAGLLLARAAARRKEIATRLALGAGRIRIVRQLLTESVALALAGGAAGLLVGTWLTNWLRSLLPDRYLFLSFDLDFGIDWRVFAFTLAVATATGILFGLVPALHASRPDVIANVKDPQAFGRRRGPGLRGALVVAEVALSLILLVAATLCVRTLRNATAIDTGYESARVLTGRIDLAETELRRDARPAVPATTRRAHPGGARRRRRRIRRHPAAERWPLGGRRAPRGRSHSLADLPERGVAALLRRDEHSTARGPSVHRAGRSALAASGHPQSDARPDHVARRESAGQAADVQGWRPWKSSAW